MSYGMTADEAWDLAERLPAPERIGRLPIDREWREIRTYEARSGGHTATVYVGRAPALFWRVTCPDLGLDLSTGSGSDMGALASAIADAISQGMLGSAEES